MTNSESTNDASVGHFTRFRRRLSSGDKRSLAGMYAFIAVLHLTGFVALLGFVVPEHYHLGGDHPVFTVGVGVLAYTLGLRHAFDADHIAAVDNTTRKLITDSMDDRVDRQPLSVGFWFSLGHSSVVFALAFLVCIGLRALVGPVEDQDSALHTVTNLIGPSISGLFLWLIGLVNLIVLRGVLRACRELRQGRYDEATLDRHLSSRGFMNRFLGGLTKAVTKPWHVYPIGALFGLGFDTATEVGLLVLAGGAAAFDLPFYVILVLPILFAAGMCLMDTTDGVVMNYAYGWAFARPARKIFYNLTITTLSVAVALIVGTIELVGVLADRFHIDSGPLAAIAETNLDHVGFIIVAMFLVSWIVAVAVWRFGHVERRWSVNHVAHQLGQPRNLNGTHAAQSRTGHRNMGQSSKTINGHPWYDDRR